MLNNAGKEFRFLKNYHRNFPHGEISSSHFANAGFHAQANFCCREKNGAPERIRTSDPVIRSHVLYPAELRVRCDAELCVEGRGLTPRRVRMQAPKSGPGGIGMVKSGTAEIFMGFDRAQCPL